MPQETQIYHTHPNSALTRQQNAVYETGSHFERPKKRGRSSNSSGVIQNEAKRTRSQQLMGQDGEPDLLKPVFACPFCKWDRRKWGDKCILYKSRNVDTLIRHHVRGTHRKDINESQDKKLTDLPKMFSKMEQPQKDSMKWTAMYKIIVEPRNAEDFSAPSPYFNPDEDILNIGRAIEKCMADRNAKDPTSGIETDKIRRRIEKLKAERDQKKCEVYRETATEENNIRARREQQIQAIDGYYDNEIDGASQRLMELLVDEGEGATGPGTLARRLSVPNTGTHTQSLMTSAEPTLFDHSSGVNDSIFTPQTGSNMPDTAGMPPNILKGAFPDQFNESFFQDLTNVDLDSDLDLEYHDSGGEERTGSHAAAV